MKKCMSLILTALLSLTMVLPAFAWTDSQMEAAQRLHQLGLFHGTGTLEDGSPNFELDRAPSRAEAVTMLVRLLGKDSEAKNGSNPMPFTDVPDWATPYIAYAFANSYTKGISDTLFDPDTPVSPSQYLTLVLRALGYQSEVDFAWDSAWTLSDQLGITHGEYGADTPFTRGDVAQISSAALDTTPRQSQQTLLELIQSNVPEQPSPEVPETPAPSTPGQSLPEIPVSGEVWIPKSGKKYHSDPTCSNMKNPTKVTVQEATSRGFTPCSRCWQH